MRVADRPHAGGRRAQTWRQVRRRARRHRRVLGALLVGMSLLLALSALAPPDPPTATMTVAARDLPAGIPLSPGDLTSVDVPTDVVPRQALAETAALGHTLAAPLTTGEPVTEARLAGSGLLTGAPGAVALPVRVADPGASALLSPGDRIDLLAATTAGESPSVQVVAADLPVLLAPTSGVSGAGGDPAAPGALAAVTASDDLRGGLIVVAASPTQARAIVAGAAQAPLWLAMRAAPESP